MWNQLTVGKKSSGSFENIIYKMCLEIIYSIYMNKNEFGIE